MKVAVVHEWLVVEAGAEKVLEEILTLFPDADLFCLIDFLPPDQRAFIGHRTTKTSFIQRLPGARNNYRYYLPLMPLAVEQFDLGGYDLVISCNYAVAKGAITGPDQLHISYVHSPIRYAWDLQFQYLKQAGLETGLKSWLVRWCLHKLRIWDHRTAPGVDHYIANSDFIARRIKKVYGREAVTIHPPVDTDFFTPAADREEVGDFYLTVSRLVPYKRIDIIVQAFADTPHRRLVVIGDGPERNRLLQLARNSSNIEIKGHLDRKAVRDHMRRARAFIFAAEEDFGIVPLEAQACGTPVIAYGKGGVLETIRGRQSRKEEKEGDSPKPATGIFFQNQTAADLKKAILDFEENEKAFTTRACRENALRFKVSSFRRKLSDFIERCLQKQGEK
ncbi:MAG: glycosyltransferase family 4 protein [Deltaproteobacteria bacterium]|nr:glycosyltransferase family 4 protein [Deltaproteobacteria bacterium]